MSESSNVWYEFANSLAQMLYVENNVPKDKACTLLLPEAKLCLSDENVIFLRNWLNGEGVTGGLGEGSPAYRLSNKLYRIRCALMSERIRLILREGKTPEEVGYDGNWKIDMLPLPSIAITKLRRRKVYTIRDFAKLSCSDLHRRFGMNGGYARTIEKCIRSKAMREFRQMEGL